MSHLAQKEPPLVQHHGIFRRQISLLEGTALIVSGTIGAGVLGIPYAVAKVGVGIGLAYIIVLGLLMLGLNLLIGELAVRTRSNLQLVGLARTYLGRPGEIAMTILMYVMLFGVLVVYIIGEGQTLSALFGGSPLTWSTIFFVTVTALVALGLRTIKTVELFLSLGILLVVLLITSASAPHIAIPHLLTANLAQLLFPYGVILFAFHSTTSIPEAHSLLARKDATLKKAIFWAGVISLIVYALFALVVVGVTGQETTEIATIGLGRAMGPVIFLLGNLFAILAMGTSALMVSLSLRDSLRWDYHWPYWLSTVLVCGLPFIIFLSGVRHFIAAIDVIGGVFVSLEMLLLLLIYWRAKQLGHWRTGKYRLHHTALIGAALLLALLIGVLYSIGKLF